MATASHTSKPAPAWPVVVAGLSGSGTRLVVAILRSAGVYMGSKVNATEDALAFRRFKQTWVRPFLQHRLGQLHHLRRIAAGSKSVKPRFRRLKKPL